MSRFIVLAAACALVVVNTGWTAPRDAGSRARDSASTKEEKIGLGSGAAIGAIAGGPIGLIIGAAIGGFAGDRFGHQRKRNEDLEQSYGAATAEAASLQMMLLASESDLADMRAVLDAREADFRDALRDALDVQVYFHTGEAELDTRTQERLEKLGQVLQVMDGFTIVVEGHADARGDEDYNEQLSAERAAAVRDVLIRSGLSAERISSQAVGERFSTADEKDLDSLALERRVELSVVAPESRQRVARQ